MWGERIYPQAAVVPDRSEHLRAGDHCHHHRHSPRPASAVAGCTTTWAMVASTATADTSFPSPGALRRCEGTCGGVGQGCHRRHIPDPLYTAGQRKTGHGDGHHRDRSIPLLPSTATTAVSTRAAVTGSTTADAPPPAARYLCPLRTRKRQVLAPTLPAPVTPRPHTYVGFHLVTPPLSCAEGVAHRWLLKASRTKRGLM